MDPRCLTARVTRFAAALSLLSALALVVAPAVYADTASITVRDAAGNEDPVANVGRTLSLRGKASAPRRIFVRFRAPGGAACTPSASSDAGRALGHDGSRFYGSSGGDAPYYGSSVNGDFDISRAGRWTEGAGTFMFCIWIADSSSTATTPITQTITFRASNGTVSSAVSPSTLQPTQLGTLTVTGTTEAPAEIYVKTRAAGGAPCASTFAADPGSEILDGRNVDGTFSQQTTISREEPGTYLVCTWLAESSSDTTPIAGPQPTTFQVAAPPPPPPPCIVPALAPGTSVAEATGALTAANCTVGRRRYALSRSYARGTVIRLGSSSGTTLPNRAAVDLLISRGRPCLVPRAQRGLSLRRARSRIRSAGCRAGRVRRVRSSRRRGTVVRFSPRAGTHLAGGSVVRIYVSRGRR